MAVLKANRRAFLRDGALIITAGAMSVQSVRAFEYQPVVRAGLVTDLHYADKPPAGTRHYRETLGKLEEAAIEFERSQLSFVVELGDLIDAAETVASEQSYLKTINRKFSQVCNQRHYVLGNHCVDTLTKEEFLAGVEQQKSYYSFEEGGIRFIVLDSCFRADGVAYGRKNFRWTDANIPEKELEWLRSDLVSTKKPVVVFAHQRLDVNNDHGVNNNAEVRTILEQSGNVLAVFQGHSHKNDLRKIGGIHYCTLVAMVEGSGESNSGYSILEIAADGTLKLQGFRNQSSRIWA